MTYLFLTQVSQIFALSGFWAGLSPRQLYAQALALRKQRLGEEHPLVAISLNNLGDLYSAQGRCNKAEPLYLQALEIAERKLATNHHYTVGFRENLQKLRDTRTS